jgi:hypothetical protein
MRNAESPQCGLRNVECGMRKHPQERTKVRGYEGAVRMWGVGYPSGPLSLAGVSALTIPEAFPILQS